MRRGICEGPWQSFLTVTQFPLSTYENGVDLTTRSFFKAMPLSGASLIRIAQLGRIKTGTAGLCLARHPQDQKAAKKLCWHARRAERAKVDLVHLVCFVHLVSLVQLNKPNRPNKQERPASPRASRVARTLLANFFSILLGRRESPSR